MKRPDQHARYRELISERLDRPLSRSDQRALIVHLRTCEHCRRADHDYREQRSMLRAMREPLPPRDMWARTSAALDGELARPRPHAGRALRRARRGTERRSTATGLATLVAALGLVTALAVLQVAPAIAPRDEALTPLRPTPFAVAPQALAFLGTGEADVAIYRTDVSRVCPASAPDCYSDEGIVRTPIALPTRIKPRDLALSPSGSQLALVGVDLGEDFVAVVQMPDGVRPHDGDPTPDPSPTATDDATPTRSPAETRTPGSTPDGTRPEPSDEPAATASAGNETGAPEPTAPVVGSTEAPTPPPSAVPGLTVLAILEDVQSAGSPPEWSVDGTVLAFSAMPADGRHGPDVYLWREGDQRAQPLTSDHATFFASWAGSRIVASRIIGEPKQDGPRVVTVVIDPVSGEERRADGPPLWLPVVNVTGTHAVAWYGTLDWSGSLPAPGTGALYVVDWSLIDPFARGAQDQPSEAPGSSPPAKTSPGAGDDASSAPEPTRAADKMTKQPEQSASAEPTATSGDGPDGDATPAPSPAPGILSAVDPDRDPERAPVTDWQVRWSRDGQLLGVWVADAAGASWGRLVVVALDARGVSHEEPLLDATLARRGFSLGINRVAWVAPTDASPEGELRIRTWGTDGVGGLRVRPLDLREVVPSF